MATKFETFKGRWLEEIEKDNLSNLIKGRKFAKKILKEWLGYDYDDNSEIIDCFGDRDGGIDVAYLQRMDEDEENGHEGDTWYLIQTGYGRAFEGAKAIISEGSNVIYALDGKRSSLSSLSGSDTLHRLQTFKNLASDKDKFVLLLATIDPLEDEQKESLKDIKGIGVFRLGQNFDAININLRTLFNRHNEDEEDKKITVSIYADLEKSGEELLIGSVKLQDLYNFLKEYENKRGEFDLIYKKNVRMFLGGGKKINQGIAETIRNKPERFGLYNNGITMVVEDYKKDHTKGKYELMQPYIVNGCQTTKIIYRELKKKLDNPSFYPNTEHEKYLEKLSKGILVVKIVKATNDENGKELLKETTRYTNSQNTVSLKDFIALDDKFQDWAKEMEKEYNVFLEIQRGEYLFRKDTLVNDHWVNAFDLIKIYGAAYLEEPGIAYGRNQPFAPGGRIFKKITESKYFGLHDLYACYLLFKLSKEHHFGERRLGTHQRSQTGYLFLYVFIQLLKDVMENNRMRIENHNVSEAIILILENNQLEAAMNLYNPAITIIEDYMTTDKENSMSKEVKYTGNSNAFLKNNNLGKSDWSPNLIKLINIHKKILKEVADMELPKCQAIIDIISSNIKRNNKTVKNGTIVTGTKPFNLIILSQNYEVNNWKGVLVQTLNHAAHSKPETFAKFANNVKFLGKEKSIFRAPKELKNGYYTETNYSADIIYGLCIDVMETIGLTDKDWSIEYN